jgi:hypothetical protein
MAIAFNDNFDIRAAKPIDKRYLNSSNASYTNVAQANAQIPSSYRHVGLTVLIGSVEYWYIGGTADVNLVAKSSGGPGGNFIASDGPTTISAASAIDVGAANRLSFTGSFTTGATGDKAINFTGAFTVRNTASDIFDYLLLDPVITTGTGVNNQVVSALSLRPTFNHVSGSGHIRSVLDILVPSAAAGTSTFGIRVRNATPTDLFTVDEVGKVISSPGANITSGSHFISQNTFNYSVNANSFFKINPKLTYSSTNGGYGFEVADNTITASITGTGASYMGNFSYHMGAAGTFNGTIGALRLGTRTTANPTGSFNPNAGTGVLRGLVIDPIINTSGSYSGTGIMVDINPQLDGVVGYTNLALRATSGSSVFGHTALVSPSARMEIRAISGGTGLILYNSGGTQMFAFNNGSALQFGLDVNTYMSAATSGIIRFQMGSTSTANQRKFAVEYSSFTAVNGTNIAFGISNYAGGFSPTSGNANMNWIQLDPTINPTASFSGGGVTAFLYKPASVTGVALAHHRGIIIAATDAAANAIDVRSGFGVEAPTSILHIGASNTNRASLCLDPGSAPGTPINGQMWTTATDLFIRLNGTTYTIQKV